MPRDDAKEAKTDEDVTCNREQMILVVVLSLTWYSEGDVPRPKMDP